MVGVPYPIGSYRYGVLHMSDKQVTHLSDQEYVQFVVNSREDIRIRVAFLGLVPDTDKVSIGIEVVYAGDTENTDAE